MEIVKGKMEKKTPYVLKSGLEGKVKKKTPTTLCKPSRDGFLGLRQPWLQELNSLWEEEVLVKPSQCSSLSKLLPAPGLPTDGPSAFPASLDSRAPVSCVAEEEQTRGFTVLSLQLSFVMSIKCPELCLFRMDNSAFCSSSCLFKSWM